MYRYSAYRRLAKVAGCPAAAPCQHRTVPKRVGKTTLEQRRPRLERPLCAAIEPRFQTQTDTGGGKGIPRALMRNTTITRLPRSIATAFPSATRGRCVHERDRRFESVSLLRGAIFANLIPRPGRITGNRRFESSSLQRISDHTANTVCPIKSQLTHRTQPTYLPIGTPQHGPDFRFH